MNNELYNFSFSVLTGCISGLLVSALSFVAYLFFRNVIFPWYVKTIYKGVDVSGTWRGGFRFATNASNEVKTVFSIKQNAFDLEGVFFAETIYADDPEKNYSNQYKFTGKIQNNLVIINYEAMSNKRTGTGVLVAKTSHGGTILSGYVVHSEDIDTMWVESNFKLDRD